MRAYVTFFGVISIGIGLAALAACVGDSPATPPGADGGGNDAGTDSTPPGDGASCTAPLQACGAKCVNLADDPENCGTCGRSCGGATCKSSACQPVVLAEKIDAPWGLAVMDSPPVVIIAAKPSLLRCAKTGCSPPQPLWSATTFPPRVDTSIAVDPTNNGTAYAIVDTPDAGVQVRRSPVQSSGTNPSPTNGVSVGPTAHALNIEGNRLVISRDPSILTCLMGSCAGPFDIVYSSLYLGDAVQAPGTPGDFIFGGGSAGIDGLRKCPRNLPCNSNETLARSKSGAITFTQVVGTTVYWVDQTGAKARVLACPVPGCSDPTLIADGEETIGGLAVDSKAAYWTTTVAGVIRACRDPVKGCGAVATNLVTGLTAPKQIVQDAQAIYWVNEGVGANTGSLMKLAK